MHNHVKDGMQYLSILADHFDVDSSAVSITGTTGKGENIAGSTNVNDILVVQRLFGISRVYVPDGYCCDYSLCFIEREWNSFVQSPL